MKVDGSDQNDKGKSLERSPVQSLKGILNSDYVKNRFMEVMGEKTPAFLASILNAMQKNSDLAMCDQGSILSSAMVAATLDLPIDSNLGFAAIVPYNNKMVDKKTNKEYWVKQAQFQIMYKGFIQLALRSGQYKSINVSPVYEDEFEAYDIITGDIRIHPVSGGYREQENIDKIIGYAAFFRLINGFERLEYWSLSRIKAHGERFSKSFKSPTGLWKKEPHAMYAKTVLKSMLSKWGILSVTMQNAITVDQAVIKDFKKPIDGENVSYVDAASADAAVAESENVEQQEETAPAADESAAEKPQEKPAPPAGNGNGKAAQADKGNTPAAQEENIYPEDEDARLEEQFREQQELGPDFG